MNFALYRFETNISEKDLLEEVDKLNNDTNTSGFIVQLPLPDSIDDKKIINAINPAKDVD
jgi:methylenetetrahydrofolate dehydrogenase (NADP+)/methenyltetrahydrofolate cyclohydrolase